MKPSKEIKHQAVAGLIQEMSSVMMKFFETKNTLIIGMNEQQQTNPFADFDEIERQDVIFEAMFQILGQMTAVMFIEENGRLDQKLVYSNYLKKIQSVTDLYHQKFLEMKEAASAGKGS